MRPLIFERFSQLSPANRANGRGLGLYIAKGLVTAQRGSIWVDGEEGMGARFSFALPLALPAPMDRSGSTMRAGVWGQARLGRGPGPGTGTGAKMTGGDLGRPPRKSPGFQDRRHFLQQRSPDVDVNVRRAAEHFGRVAGE